MVDMVGSRPGGTLTEQTIESKADARKPFHKATTMSNPHRPHFPPETFDYIVDFLCDEPKALRNCCLAAKSWVPRTRKHLFADVRFLSASKLKQWKATFPDPSSSPAYHTRTLLVGCFDAITATDAEDGGWIRTFSGVVNLMMKVVVVNNNYPSLIPLHGLSPVLRHLFVISNVTLNSQAVDLICSLPFLEDLAWMIIDFNSSVPLTVTKPSTSPAFTGTLDLTLFTGMGSTASQLLGLPNGLHFRKLVLTWCHREDVRWVTALVEGCSDTLECLDIDCDLPCTVVLVLCRNCDLPCL